MQSSGHMVDGERNRTTQASGFMVDGERKRTTRSSGHTFDRERKRTTRSPYEMLDPGTQPIRLLILKAGRDEEDVHCELQVVSLLDEPRPAYETIS
ncbi:hypothetical protein LTR95_000588 [Oleoguttula sp. CCFEE 5521]